MKILALYDIHGNVDALDAVLADARAAGPDAIVAGGDVVPGAFARAALDRLEALDVPVHWIRGNGEREVADAAAGTAPAPDPEDLALVTAALTAGALDPARARALGALPLTVELDGVLFCHATPRTDEELVTRISSAARWAEVLGGVTHGLVVAGHTHQQDDRTVGAVRFVNAGSVGLPYEGDGAARWAWIEDGAPTLNHTNYDAAAAGHRILAAGWPDERSTAAALTDPLPASAITELFEARIA
jgi:predicted phosphodiesterase